jgi:hypothetical protein
MINEYPIESNVFQPVTVRLDGSVHLSGILFAIVPPRERPVGADFKNATIIGGATGIMTEDAPGVGTWHVWAMVTDVAPELPWIDCGPVFRIE